MPSLGVLWMFAKGSIGVDKVDDLKTLPAINPCFRWSSILNTLIRWSVNPICIPIRKSKSGYSPIFKLILTIASGVPILIFDEPGATIKRCGNS